MLAALNQEGIDAWHIGRVVPKEEGIMLRRAEKLSPMPTFERDEIARYFEDLA